MSTELNRDKRIEKLAGALRTAFQGDAEFEKVLAARFKFESGNCWFHFAELIVDLDD